MNKLTFRKVCLITISVLVLVFSLVLSYEYKAQSLLDDFNSKQQQVLIKEARSGNKLFSFVDRAIQDAEEHPSPATLDEVRNQFGLFAQLIRSYQNGDFAELSSKNTQFSAHIMPLANWVNASELKLKTIHTEELPQFSASMEKISPHLRLVVSALEAKYNANLEIKKQKLVGFGQFRIFLNSILLTFMLGFAFFALRTMWRNQQTLLQLQNAEQKAQAANLAKSRFLAGVSHEMRTPLTTILGYAEMMQKNRTLSQQDSQHLKHVINSSHHLQTLLGNVLDMSKIEAGGITLQSSNLDIEALRAELNAIFEPKAQEKGLRLSIDIAASVPPHLILDAGKWRQIMLNLICNAIKFSDSGDIQVVFSAKDLGCREWRLSAMVSDQGMGIDASEAEFVFKPFEQTQSGLIQGGTGLGLTLSQEFARNMGGDITFSSQIAQGSIFTVVVAAQTGDAATAAPASCANLSNITILLVEDQAINRDLMRCLLISAGASVIEAEHGQIALDLLAQGNEIHCVIIDRNMPVLDGVATVTTMRERGFAQPVLMVSAGLRPSNEEMLQIGLNAWLGKPFNADELINTIYQVYSNERPTPIDVESDTPRSEALLFNPLAQNRIGFEVDRFIALVQKGMARICAIAQQLGDNDQVEDCRLAHSGKGIAMQIGAERLAAALAQIELEQGQFNSEQIDEISDLIRATQTAIAEYAITQSNSTATYPNACTQAA